MSDGRNETGQPSANESAVDGLLPQDPHAPKAAKSAEAGSAGATKVEGGTAPGDASKPAKVRKAKKSTESAAHLIQVTKSFGPTIAVNELSLRVPAGSVYGLIGPNGAGKTTTFSMLAGYLAPTRGEIHVLGHSPTDADALRSRIGVLPQDALLPASDKVGEFLVYAARLQDIPANKAEQLAREVLSEVSGRDWWDTRCGALSHGMAKRVALAQALLGDPEVVLLDEPTAGLDPRVAYEVRQIVSSRKGRCTLIVSSHNLQELEQICDAAAILDRGRVVAEGTMAELTATSEEIRIQLAPGPVPLAPVRELPMVKRVEFDDERRELVVYFERRAVDAETVIGATLSVLLPQGARISGVAKGRGLEKRVMEMTAGEDG
jgi:ABC-2 type transport system ATP-binding protein